ncbi:MAG: class I SAM-dependent methyltransferase family protein [Gemmatimonadaceae bacterium]
MITLPNRTRTSPSIPRRLLREGKLHLLPVYALMRTSDLGREGIDNSGSFRFADHIYRNQPSGRYGIGRLVDAVLLRLRGARSMRSRFVHSQSQIIRAATERPDFSAPFRVLSVPCGIARELAQSLSLLREKEPHVHAQAQFFGIDLDPDPLERTRRLIGNEPGIRLVRGDALDARVYPHDLDVIVSTGFGEFLADDALQGFYAICHATLRSGGILVTSCMQRDRLADYLMRELAELRAHYRHSEQLRRLLVRAGFHDVAAQQDPTGLQSLVVARKLASVRA